VETYHLRSESRWRVVAFGIPSLSTGNYLEPYYEVVTSTRDSRDSYDVSGCTEGLVPVATAFYARTYSARPQIFRMPCPMTGGLTFR